MTCEGEAMATADAFLVVAVEAGFVDGAEGAIGTCECEEMATVEAFIIAATVAGFVDRDGGAIGTCEGSKMATVEAFIVACHNGGGLCWVEENVCLLVCLRSGLIASCDDG